MVSPFKPFANLIVRIPRSTGSYQDDLGNPIAGAYTNLDLLLFAEPTKEPLVPKGVQRVSATAEGINDIFFKGYFVTPFQKPPGVALSTNYLAVYRPKNFQSTPTITYGLFRFHFNPLDPVDASAFTGDNFAGSFVYQGDISNPKDYPKFEAFGL